MSVMLGSMAVETVVNYLNSQKLESIIVDSVGKPLLLVAYKYDKPSTVRGEYIAVNHLPFRHKGTVEEGVVNINIHSPKMKSGEANTKRLEYLAQVVSGLFPEDTYLGKAFYEFLTDSRPTPDNDNTYYVNIQLNVIFNNLNY